MDNTTANPRKSKIARLPRVIREQLNRRLDDGEAPAPLLEWLNARSRVKEILSAEFAGREISEQNLSDWRQTGFQDWVQRQDQLADAQSVLDESEDLEDASAGEDLLDRLSNLAAISLGKLLRKLSASDEPQPAAILSVVREIGRLRKADTESRKVRLEWAQWEAKQVAEAARQAEAEEDKVRMQPAQSLRDLVDEITLLAEVERRLEPEGVEHVRNIYVSQKRASQRYARPNGTTPASQV